jgi:hypothetical protein
MVGCTVVWTVIIARAVWKAVGRILACALGIHGIIFSFLSTKLAYVKMYHDKKVFSPPTSGVQSFSYPNSF